MADLDMEEVWALQSTDPLLSPALLGDAPVDLLLSTVRCTLLRAGWCVCAPDWRVPKRQFPHHILWLCLGGAADIVIDGTRYLLEPGGLLLVPPGVWRQANHDPANPFRVLVAHFTARVHGVLDLSMVLAAPRLMHPAPDRFHQMVQTVCRIVQGLANAEVGTTLAVQGDCARLVALLWREAAERRAGQLAHSPDRIATVARLAPVFQTIEMGYAGRLTLKELARTVHLHPAYFSTLFKDLTGFPPLRYLARFRLDRVRELLLTTDLSIQDIASRTGYCDSFYLSHVFRQAEGMPPSEYRKSKDFASL